MYLFVTNHIKDIFLDYSQSPAQVIDVTESMIGGVPNWFATSPISLKNLAWFRVLLQMQPYWKSKTTTNRYHIPQLIALWDQLLWSFPSFHVDPLLLLSSLNEPGVNKTSCDLVTSFSNSPLVGSDRPFSSGALM